MTSPLHRLWSWLQGGTVRLVLLAGFLLLTWGMLAPVGTLVWWLNQSSASLGPRRESESPEPGAESESTEAASSGSGTCYLVFLTGVGDYSVDQLTPGEEYFLGRLRELRPDCVAVTDVFPYSVANKDLAGERFLTPLWDAIEHADGWLENADVLIKIRNLWRFAISADDRYGPVYNQGIADAILDRMQAAQPLSTSEPLTVILIGTSGGAQVALGAVPYLQDWLDAQITVVSAGGVFDGESGFESVDQVYHLQGDRDWVEDIPQILFPAHWPWVVGAPINQARRQGRYHVINSGPHEHDGEEGYFGKARVESGDANSPRYVDLTVEQVNELPIWPP